VALTSVDPGVLVLMRVSSELMEARDTIRRQRRQLLALASALRTQQVAVAAMSDVLDTLLERDGDG
jgi:hypothetical protein